jgi:hypothetical protein
MRNVYKSFDGKHEEKGVKFTGTGLDDRDSMPCRCMDFYFHQQVQGSGTLIASDAE